ncbi:hypothetical protein [Microbacterium sp. 1P06AB]|uniref:hypothetical protein n=1 Tax=Microbacterium sp. 1P06AB TaxID=3132289 RepID=UPI0039A6888B
MDDTRPATPADLPARPAWSWTASEVTSIIGIPLITYVGGVAASGGSVPGFILVCFAAIGMVTFQALRVTRRNQPRTPRYTNALAVAVAVISIVTGWNLLQFTPSSALSTWLGPAVPVILFLTLVALIRWGRR